VVHLSYCFFMVLICGVFKALFFNSCGVFNFSIAIFLLLLVSLFCSQVHILIVILSVVPYGLYSPCESLVFSSKIKQFVLFS
jgi:hypothetical protein